MRSPRVISDRPSYLVQVKLFPAKSRWIASLVSIVVFSVGTFFAENAEAGWEWKGGIDSLIIQVIAEAEKTFGKHTGSPKVFFGWCEGRTAYLIAQKYICFDPKFMQDMASIGDAAVAYVAAHEYAHHIQRTSTEYGFSGQGLNTLQRELQADCFAGALLGFIPNIFFDENDVKEMIVAAALIGDQEYDSGDHHGSGEMRALALRSGIKFASTRVKDNYFSMFCSQN